MKDNFEVENDTNENTIDNQDMQNNENVLPTETVNVTESAYATSQDTPMHQQDYVPAYSAPQEKAVKPKYKMPIIGVVFLLASILILLATNFLSLATNLVIGPFWRMQFDSFIDFCGLENFKIFFSNPHSLEMLIKPFFLYLCALFSSFIPGLLLALMVSAIKNKYAKYILFVLFALPIAIPTVAVFVGSEIALVAFVDSVIRQVIRGTFHFKYVAYFHFIILMQAKLIPLAFLTTYFVKSYGKNIFLGAVAFLLIAVPFGFYVPTYLTYSYGGMLSDVNSFTSLFTNFSMAFAGRFITQSASYLMLFAAVFVVYFILAKGKIKRFNNELTLVNVLAPMLISALVIVFALFLANIPVNNLSINNTMPMYFLLTLSHALLSVPVCLVLALPLYYGNKWTVILYSILLVFILSFGNNLYSEYLVFRRLSLMQNETFRLIYTAIISNVLNVPIVFIIGILGRLNKKANGENKSFVKDLVKPIVIAYVVSFIMKWADYDYGFMYMQHNELRTVGYALAGRVLFRASATMGYGDLVSILTFNLLYLAVPVMFMFGFISFFVDKHEKAR